ncbi:SagB/ThcOx family dehydrogenase [Natrinema salaciae]|uniref:SagB-type dehydrogenase domain-containing protein n=1 Tax=Natrinema salaciae TaxID=1186196 RepID=A0A1H9LDF8_9EURY|nr:SagB/ThcOx family dehydrogenase [Natrinema salaciae]SER09444.1 SagB-type dehydrogenase domain-containing protein [Natrinema salaciae]
MTVLKSNYCLTITADTSDQKRGFVVEDLLNNVRYDIDGIDRLASVLDFGTTWKSRDSYKQYLIDEFDVSVSDAESAVDQFVENDFLVTPDSRPVTVESSIREWEEYGWGHAADYYLSIYDFPFNNYTSTEGIEYDDAKMAQYEAEETPPDIYKHYPEAETVSLPEPSLDPEVTVGAGFEYWVNRDENGMRTESPSAAFASNLLYYTVGALNSDENPEEEATGTLRKAVPSGGARHPIETYVLIEDVDGVPEGLYHYSDQNHHLSLLDETIDIDDLEAHIPELSGYNRTRSIVLLYTASLDRSMWRYREPRTYSVVHNDLGHIVETMRIISNSHGRAFQCNFGFDAEAVEDLLEIDGFEEPLLAFGAVYTVDDSFEQE